MVGGIELTHPDRELWPGITKQELAEYWVAMADHALPGLARRPLAIVRCPEGIGGEHFFQKHGHGTLPAAIRTGEASRQPFLAFNDADGLAAMAQISAIELHAWGATEADPLHPDLIVFDLDPGEGVPFTGVVTAAIDIRDQLRRLGLESFCRTTGGKGLHVVVPLDPIAHWDEVKPFCRAFAETISQDQPDRYLSTVKKVDRRGKILVDWLRNGMGATAVASFCPRARPGAAVATPVTWDEVDRRLDPATFTLRNIPDRFARMRSDPWQGFATTRQRLPDLASKPATPKRSQSRARKSVIVQAAKPRRRS
jgi:bifunctional non-homologous end joining protein LigD